MPLPSTTEAGEPPAAGFTVATGELRKTLPVATRGSASWSATACMPLAGMQLGPTAKARMMSSNVRDVTPSFGSKKVPLKNGRKNLSMMLSENPSP